MGHAKPNFDMNRVQGCLALLAVSDRRAVRRHPDRNDEDGWLFECSLPFRLDVEKLMQSKAARRLARKTQVILLPRNSHARDRLSHSLEVACVAAEIGRILGLNSDLCFAAGVGHDIGHAPLGHRGEAFLARQTGRDFRHEVMGVVIAQHIERKGGGLNLCLQTLQAMRHHSRGKGDLTLVESAQEDNVVMYADKISYLFADFNDLFGRNAMTGSPLRLEDFGELAEVVDWFGATHRTRVRTALEGLCLESLQAGRVQFTDSDTAKQFHRLKSLMYGVYPLVHAAERPDPATGLDEKGDAALERVYEALARLEPDVDPAILFALLNDEDFSWLAAKGNIGRDDFDRLSLAEIVPHIRGKNIDFTDADLRWGDSDKP